MRKYVLHFYKIYCIIITKANIHTCYTMLNFLFGLSRKSSERSSLQGQRASGSVLERRAARATNHLIERISAREDRAE